MNATYINLRAYIHMSLLTHGCIRSRYLPTVRYDYNYRRYHCSVTLRSYSNWFFPHEDKILGGSVSKMVDEYYPTSATTPNCHQSDVMNAVPAFIKEDDLCSVIG